VEAYVGALFVDSAFDYRVVEDFFETHIRPYFEDMSLYDEYANKHPTVSTEVPLVKSVVR
jgi:endoribonuclease Dicer